MPKPPTISAAAAALGRLAAGKPKTYTEEERQRRRARLAAVRHLRHTTTTTRPARGAERE